MDRIVTLKTEQKMAELQAEQKRLESDRGKLADLVAKVDEDRAAVDEKMRSIHDMEARAASSMEEAKSELAKLEKKEHDLAMAKVDLEKTHAAIDAEREGLETQKAAQEQRQS